MDTSALWGIILGMAVVTYIPRLLPAAWKDWSFLPDWAKRWLRSIPYAALGALIFPGILSVEPGDPWVGLAAGGVAALLSWFRLHILWVMMASVLVVMAWKGGVV